MARPTIEQQKIISARNSALIDLVVRKGFSQSEVGRLFNISRATVNQVVTDYNRPKTLGEKLLKEWIFNKLVEAEKNKKQDEYATTLGIEWRSNRACGVYKDYPINKSATTGSNMGALWDEVLHWVPMDSWENGTYPSTEKEIEMVETLEEDLEIIRSEDIVVSHKGAIYAIIRIGESFGDEEYKDIHYKISIPAQRVLSLDDIDDLTIYEI